MSPCEDLYAHVCGPASRNFSLRPDRSRHLFAFSDAEEYLLEVKKDFFKSLNEQSKTTGALSESKSAGALVGSDRRSKLLKIYQACMNEPAARVEERAFVLSQRDEIQALATRPKLIEWSGNRVLSSELGPISISRMPNVDRPLNYDGFLISPLQSLPERSYYERPELLKDLAVVIQAQFEELGLSPADSRAAKVLELEKQFAQTFPLPQEFRDRAVQRRHVTLEQVVARFPNLGLRALKAHLPKKLLFRDLAPENMKYLNELMGREDLQALKDFFTWRSLSGYMDDAFPRYHKSQFDFDHKYLGGPPQRPDRAERCTEMIKNQWGRELDAELLPELFPTFPTGRVVQLAERVRKSILESLAVNSWLSTEGHKVAIKKIRTATLQLVSPSQDEEWDFNPPVLIEVDKPNSNARRLREAQMIKLVSEFFRPRNPRVWEMSPLAVNAYYDPSANRFVLPIGILQPPFFDPALSDTVNLASMGSVVAHELGHAIDDKGARYDEQGRLRDWMSQEDLKKFSKLSAPLVEQFERAGMNGAYTLGENIGDLVGLTFSYRTAFAGGGLAVGNAQDLTFEKKDFFRQYARLWCEVVRPEYAAMLVKVDAHSSGRLRANEQVKHQDDFHAVFRCRAGNNMFLEPSRRVKIW